ncbi:MAG: hypothetical protein AABY15_05215 [Nanoarchaeota archaeon]
MAKKATAPSTSVLRSNRRKRKGVHSKKKNSKSKKSKNYRKVYKGQGK